MALPLPFHASIALILLQAVRAQEIVSESCSARASLFVAARRTILVNTFAKPGLASVVFRSSFLRFLLVEMLPFN